MMKTLSHKGDRATPKGGFLKMNQFRFRTFPIVMFAVAMLVPLLRAETVTPLHGGWQLQSSRKLNATGKEISSAGFNVKGWISTQVPSTVVAAQVAAGIFPNPYFGDNLRKLPGMDYEVGANYSNLPMPESSPYDCGWWYRDEFTAPVTPGKPYYWLHFNGINYRADIWLNGHKIADSTQIAGANRRYDLNVTKDLRPGKQNVLAVEVWAPTPHQLAFTFVDWNPMPPDKDMGLWGKVNLVATGPISLRFPMAATNFPSTSKLNVADLTAYAQLRNATGHAVRGTVSGTAAGAHFEQTVSLAPNEEKTVEFTPERFPQLRIRHPKVWWPRQMGEPILERLTMSVSANGRVSDEESVNFGIREITSELTAQQGRLFRINGKPLLVRGGGWTQDMMLRQNPERLREQFKLVRHLNLNTLRLEGQMEPTDFFNQADKNGILVFPGWVCCAEWQLWHNWTPQTLEVAKASLRSQILRLRSHPSVMVWLNGSDIPPVPHVERAYLAIEAELHWPDPIVSSASQMPTKVTGISGVKMTGPYDYVEPSYWWVAMQRKGNDFPRDFGGAYIFNTETSPGPSMMGLASRKKFLPDPNAWPPTDDWKLHYSGGGFRSMHVLDRAMDAMYAKPASLDEYVRLADTMEYDSERAEFESYSGNKYVSTGVIQWMLNNAWPSFYWHLYDYYLSPGASYYAVKKACQPLHIEYDYKNRSILVVNSTYHAAPNLRASMTVHSVQWDELYSKEAAVNAAADSSQMVFTVPRRLYSGAQPILLINLKLSNDAGKVVSRNFYWVPNSLTEFDWTATNYTHTPAKVFPDLTALTHLPQAAVTAHAEIEHTMRGREVRLQLKNPSSALAFQVRFELRTPSGGLIAPVIWSDDWVELTPGESRTFTTAPLPKDAPRDAVIELSGWNIPSATITPVSAAGGTAQ